MEQKKVNQSTVKETAANTKPTTRKIRENLTFIVLAVVIATAFFIHEGFPTISDDLYQAKINWETAKSENAKALNALKQLNFDLRQGKITLNEFAEQQPALVDAYTQINTKKNELHKIFEEGKSEAKFFQFKSFQYFLGEIGWALGLFLYALVNLFNIFYLRTRFVKREFTGKLLLHSTLLFIGCFYTFYVFYTKDDFAQGWYILAMILCTLSLVVASRLIADSYSRRAIHQNKKMEADLEAKRKTLADIEERIIKIFNEKTATRHSNI